MSGPRNEPVLTMPDHVAGGNDAMTGAMTGAAATVQDGHELPSSLGNTIQDDPHAPGRLGVVRGIAIGLVISAGIWVGLVALVRFIWD